MGRLKEEVEERYTDADVMFGTDGYKIDTRYQCSHCEESFGTTNQLLNHIKRKHSDYVDKLKKDAENKCERREVKSYHDVELDYEDGRLGYYVCIPDDVHIKRLRNTKNMWTSWKLWSSNISPKKIGESLLKLKDAYDIPLDDNHIKMTYKNGKFIVNWRKKKEE